MPLIIRVLYTIILVFVAVYSVDIRSIADIYNQLFRCMCMLI